MHEMSLAEGVMSLVEDAARIHGFNKVRTVRVEIGRLAAVETDALRFAFDVVTRGSVAEGAALDIINVPGAAWCMRCGDTVPIGARGDACPNCGSYQLQIGEGTEMRVKELELA